VAAKKSSKYPHQWADGTWHSKPQSTGPAKGLPAGPLPNILPDPPVGTYDPAIDYNAGAANRGYSQTLNDAQTAFEQGQQDYGLGLGDLTMGRDRTLADLLTGRDRGLADLLTGETRLNQDYGDQTRDRMRQFGILARQQAEGAAQRGITSAGLLAKSGAARNANAQLAQAQIDKGYQRGAQDIGTQRTRVGEDYTRGTTRTGEDFTRGKLGLDLGNARTFGGFNGQTILNPLTGQPEFGSLLTGVTRAGGENTAFQTAASQQRAAGAQSMGYVSPLLQPSGTTPQEFAFKQSQRDNRTAWQKALDRARGRA
jgi:hypothetical protein